MIRLLLVLGLTCCNENALVGGLCRADLRDGGCEVYPTALCGNAATCGGRVATMVDDGGTCAFVPEDQPSCL